MRGLDFLVFYGVVISFTLCGCWCWRIRWDSPTDAPLPPIPKAPDPYAVAYLRGGEREVARLAIFHLLQHGFLGLTEPAAGLRKIAQSSKSSAEPPDDPWERRVLAYCSRPRLPSAML
ncbi:MAG: TIGR04222 domain-containing membrane protein, partial [Planctomycetales bacterium]